MPEARTESNKIWSEDERILLSLCALPGELPPAGIPIIRRLLKSREERGAFPKERETLAACGFAEKECDLILSRLAAAGEGDALDHWLLNLSDSGISVTTIISEGYPSRLLAAFAGGAPSVLFYAGDPALFSASCISLVGSRKLRESGQRFALEAGKQIALQGYTYCSGGAEGADSCGFEGAVEAGGSAVLYLARSLKKEMTRPEYAALIAEGRLLLLSEYSYEAGFSAMRAHSRNRLIHAMGEKTLVAQTDAFTGGTWTGTADNLKRGLSPVWVSCDEPDDPGYLALLERGAEPVSCAGLNRLSFLQPAQQSLPMP